MSRLHEKDEPFPWQTLPFNFSLIGPGADAVLTRLLQRQPHFGIVRCNGCGRWQDFPPPHTFEALLKASQAAGWRRHGQDDLCPICVGN